MNEYEAIKTLKGIRRYLTSGNPIWDEEEHEFLVLGSPYVGNPIWDVEEVYDAMTMAIVALNNVTDKPNDVVKSDNDVIDCSEKPNGSDLIRRADAIRWVKTECNPYGKATLDFESGKKVIEYLKQMPSAEATCATCADRALCIMSAPDGNWKACKDYRPSAEPKTGKWMLKEHLWECDQCGCRINRANPLKGNIWNYNYCPNCGADMRGADGEEE